jgi:hypothetical protein
LQGVSKSNRQLAAIKHVSSWFPGQASLETAVRHSCVVAAVVGVLLNNNICRAEQQCSVLWFLWQLN